MISIVFWSVYLGLGVLDGWFIVNQVAIDEANVWNWGWTIASLQAVYFFLSFKIVLAEEQALVLFFGRPIEELESGPHIVPWIICSLRKETKHTLQIQIPGEPEEIDKSGNDKDGLMKGKKVLPIRVTTGSYETAKANPEFAGDPSLNRNDPLNERMTVEVTALVRFAIKSLTHFIQNIGNLDEARRQLRDTVESVLKAELAKRTPALIIAHWDDINKEILRKLNILIKDKTETEDDDKTETEDDNEIGRAHV